MKKEFLIIAIVLFVSCSSGVKKVQLNGLNINDANSTAISGNSDNELEYLKARNAYVEYFKKIDLNTSRDTLGKLEDKALSELENRLSKILKNSPFAGEGKINLETLFQSLGFGMLDGLYLDKDSMRIFYTSKKIFSDYFKEPKINQLEDLTPPELKSIFINTFASDAEIVNFASSKIQSSKNNKAYGMLGFMTQMEGPFLPNYLFVVLESGDFIYIVEKNIENPIKEIIKCKSVWDSIKLESDKNFEIYRSSKLKDTLAIQRVHELDSKAWNEYCDCYQKELKVDGQFDELLVQFEKIVKYLEK